MKKIVLLIFGFHISFAQLNNDSIPETNTNYLNEDFYKISSLYINQQIWKANIEPSYFSLLPYIDSKRIYKGLKEPKSLHIMEARVVQRFLLAQGRDYSKLIAQKMRLTFDFDFMLRMKSGNSSPIYPMNYKFGLGLDLNVWNTENKWYLNKIGNVKDNFYKKEKNLQTVNLTLQAHHYSNGQPDDFPVINNQGINNHKNGNFSTNYLRGLLNYSFLDYKKLSNGLVKRNLWNAGIGYQWDGNFNDDLLNYADEQINKYGKNRIYGNAFSKLYFGPKTNKRTIFWDGNKLSNFREFTLRYDYEIIIDKVDKFKNETKDPKLKIKKAHRLQSTFTAQYTSQKNRTISYFAKVFTGRDYLNIRYDDVVNTYMFGAAFSLDKYFMPSLAKELIKK